MDYKNIGRHFVSKGWGFEDWLVNKGEYCGKILFFKKDKKCSWHYHKEKDETFYIQSGKLWVGYSMEDCILEGSHYAGMPNKYYPEIGGKDIKKLNYPCHEKMNFVTLEPGDTFHVPVGLRHYMYGELDTYMFEFSTQHFDEDSYRVLKGD